MEGFPRPQNVVFMPMQKHHPMTECTWVKVLKQQAVSKDSNV